RQPRATRTDPAGASTKPSHSPRRAPLPSTCGRVRPLRPPWRNIRRGGKKVSPHLRPRPAAPAAVSSKSDYITSDQAVSGKAREGVGSQAPGRTGSQASVWGPRAYPAFPAIPASAVEHISQSSYLPLQPLRRMGLDYGLELGEALVIGIRSSI